MSREALTMALEALGKVTYSEDPLLTNKAITALREALAQPEPWTPEDTAHRPGGVPQDIPQIPQKHSPNKQFTPDWNTEAVLVEEMQRMARRIEELEALLKRQPLTNEEIDELSRTMVKGNKSVNWLCRALEAAHGIGGEA